MQYDDEDANVDDHEWTIYYYTGYLRRYIIL